jgi:hypothetical protein
MSGIFRSTIQLAREHSKSVRVTIPDGVANVLGALPDGVLVWTIDLKAGRVTVSAEKPLGSGMKSAKRV